MIINKKLFIKNGFTLIELMVVVVILAILTAIAIPSYQAYARRANASQAQQEIQRLATELERWKSRNFNYLAFNLPTKSVQNYSFTVTANEQNWIILAQTSQPQNDSFVLTSTGLRCKKRGSTIALNCTGADPW